MKDELIFYDNKMNTLDFKNLDKKQLNIFMAIISQVPNAQKKNKLVIKINYERLRDLSGVSYESGPEVEKKVELLIKNLGTIAITWETPERYRYFSIFESVDWDKVNGTLTVIVSDAFKNIIDVMHNRANFTVLELRKYINLTSKAAKGLYMLLAQYKSTGVIYNLNVADLRRVLCVSEKTKNYEIISKHLVPALQVLKEEKCIVDFNKPEPIYSTFKGNPLKAVTIRYTFSGEKKSVEKSIDIKQIEETAKVLGVSVESLLALKQSKSVVKQEPKPITKVEPVEEEVPYYEKMLVADDDDYLLECVEQLKAEMSFV